MKLLSASDVIAKFKEVHGDLYDYSKVVYINSTTKVSIVCQHHGEFDQNPRSHMLGRGCKKCATQKLGHDRFDSVYEVILKFKLTHGDLYDYSNVVYSRSTDPIAVTCRDHGDFQITPARHIRGGGCPICCGGRGGWGKEDFITKSNDIATLYVIKCCGGGEHFYKIGITGKSVSTRFSGRKSMPYSYKVVAEFKGTPSLVFDAECVARQVHKKFSYIPIESFAGSTECYSEVSLTDLSRIFLPAL